MSFDYPEVLKAREEVLSALALLERSGAGHAGTLRGLLADMDSDNRFAAREAFLKAGGLCHPKALGDQRLKDVPAEEWLARLDRLEDACAAAFERLQ
jgi:hypothetical protein